MLPCEGCAYRQSIPGDCHSRCSYDWKPIKIAAMVQNVPAKCRHWFAFPFNYDPVWGPDQCEARSETADPNKTAKPNPIADLFSMLR